MIVLYKLQWSHYVEKVRWALDFKQLPWQGIDIVAFKKSEMRHFSCPQTVPLIQDPSTSTAMSDSSPIIRYLDKMYPDRPLLPDDPIDRERVWQWMLLLDSTLGLSARRLAYTQCIMECPDTLAELFMPNVWGGLFVRRGWRSLVAPVIGVMLTLRFRFHKNRHDGVYEDLEELLIPIAAHLERNDYLVGSRFTAADLTLASLLRPLRVVPHFRLHPELHSLFAWQHHLFHSHGRDVSFPYEDAIQARRQRTGTMRGKVKWLLGQNSRSARDVLPSATLTEAKNDQHKVNRWTILVGWPAYLKLRWFSGIGNVPYTPTQSGR